MAVTTKMSTSTRLGMEPAPRDKGSIRGWAVTGVVFLAIEIAALTLWIAKGEATPTDPGPTPIPGWMKGVIIGWQVIALPLVALTVYSLVYRPWRRTGRLTLYGMFTLIFFTIFWQDTILNYLVPICTYNAHFINLGAWNANILGWVSPHGNRVAEPLLWTLPIYVYLVVPWVLVGTWLMKKAKHRWPAMSNFGLVMIAFAWTATADAIIEPTFMRLGVWTYPSAIRWLSINPGKYYQFPLYEAVVWGACCAAWSALLYFLDDKGRTVAERGADNLRVGAKAKTGVRLLALTGACNAIFLVCYNIPIQFFAVHSDEWPKDIVERSYFTNGFCGPGTTYACPDPQVPFPRTGSARVGWNGELVPAGTPRCDPTRPSARQTEAALDGPAPNCPVIP